MSAADVVMAALAAIPGEQDAPEEWICEAECILDSLKAAGYAVIELPERCDADEGGYTAQFYAAANANFVRVRWSKDIVVDGNWYSADEARDVAAGLLAAADAAEATE